MRHFFSDNLELNTFLAPVRAPPYLKPLAVRLHLQHHAGVGLGESVAVRDAAAGHPQLHLGQAWRADEAQRGLGRLVDVAHGEREGRVGRTLQRQTGVGRGR